MAGAPAIATEQPQVNEAPKVERARPSLRAEKHSDAFQREVQTHAEKINTREALAGMAGWREMGKVDVQIAGMNSEVTHLLQAKVIPTEKATELFLKIGDLSKRTGEMFEPRLKKLDTIVTAGEKQGEKIDPFLRDLNYHTIKADIKSLESSKDSSANLISKFELDQLKKDLAIAEEDRKGLLPGDDEVAKIVLKITGAKTLPDRFKDAPLEAIDDYFKTHNLSGIFKSNEQANKLALKLGISTDQVRDLVRVYNQGKQLEADLKALNDQIIILDPEKGRGMRAKGYLKFGASISAILTALSAYSMFGVIKKDSGGGQ